MSTEQVTSYTAAEQQTLKDIETNARILKNIAVFLNRVSIEGKEAEAIIEANALLDFLYKQTQDQAAGIQKQATDRGSAPALQPVSSVPSLKKARAKKAKAR